MKTQSMRLFMRGLPIVLGVVLPTSAYATQKFPSAIYYHLYGSFTIKPYSPPCSLCHSRGSTGPGTAQTPFALSAKAQGLVPGDTTSLNTALSAMDKEEVDSDGDGVPDIQELREGTDPNTPADVSLASESGPTSGCGGSTKQQQRIPRDGGAIIFGLSLLPLLRRLRRKQTK
jgi:hypothetical protein